MLRWPRRWKRIGSARHSTQYTATTAGKPPPDCLSLTTPEIVADWACALPRRTVIHSAAAKIVSRFIALYALSVDPTGDERRGGCWPQKCPRVACGGGVSPHTGRAEGNRNLVSPISVEVGGDERAAALRMNWRPRRPIEVRPESPRRLVMSVGTQVCAAASTGTSHNTQSNRVYRHQRTLVAPSPRSVAVLTVVLSSGACTRRVCYHRGAGGRPPLARCALAIRDASR